MSESVVEAKLRLSAQLGKLSAFDAMAKKLTMLDQKAKQFTRAQQAHTKVMEMTAAAARLIPPAAALYGGKEAVIRFAEVEKRMVRTGLVLGATKQEMAELQGEVQKAAKAYALSTDDILGTMDAYAAAGAGISDIRADLDGLAKAQQALGADGNDIVQSWDAGRKVFGLASKDAEKFFSIIGAGSAAGKVEAADLAKMLPETLPIAARYGLQGAEGVERLVAALETMADFKGSPSEAATSLNDFLEKIASPDVEKNFKKFGVDLPRELKKARKEGRDLFETMQDLIQEATKGDATRLGYLFGDKEARSFADLLLNRLDRINDAQNKIRNAAPGLLDRNNMAVLDTADAKMQKLSTSWDNIVQKVGEGLSTAIEPALSAVSDSLDFRAAMEKGAEKRGLTWAQQQKIVTFGSAHDRGLLAYDGGWRSTPLSDKGPMHLSPELPSKRQDQTDEAEFPPLPKGAKPRELPKAGPIPEEMPPLRGAPLTPMHYPMFPVTADIVEPIKHELRTIFSPIRDSFIRPAHQMPGAGYREAEVASMRTYVRDRAILPHDLEDDYHHRSAPADDPDAPSWRDRAKAAGGVVRNTYARTSSEPMPTASLPEKGILDVDIDSERIARELDTMFQSGGNLIQQGGQQAGESIEQAGQTLAALIPGLGDTLASKIVQALSSGGSDLAAKLRSELSGMTLNIRAQGVPGGTLSGRSTGVNMPNAGTQASGANGAGPGGNGGV